MLRPLFLNATRSTKSTRTLIRPIGPQTEQTLQISFQPNAITKIIMLSIEWEVGRSRPRTSFMADLSIVIMLPSPLPSATTSQGHFSPNIWNVSGKSKYLDNSVIIFPILWCAEIFLNGVYYNQIYNKFYKF